MLSGPDCSGKDPLSFAPRSVHDGGPRPPASGCAPRPVPHPLIPHPLILRPLILRRPGAHPHHDAIRRDPEGRGRIRGAGMEGPVRPDGLRPSGRPTAFRTTPPCPHGRPSWGRPSWGRPCAPPSLPIGPHQPDQAARPGRTDCNGRAPDPGALPEVRARGHARRHGDAIPRSPWPSLRAGRRRCHPARGGPGSAPGDPGCARAGGTVA